MITYTLHKVCIITDEAKLGHCCFFKLKVGVIVALTILNLIIEPGKRRKDCKFQKWDSIAFSHILILHPPPHLRQNPLVNFSFDPIPYWMQVSSVALAGLALKQLQDFWSSPSHTMLPGYSAELQPGIAQWYDVGSRPERVFLKIVRKFHHCTISTNCEKNSPLHYFYKS